VHPQEGAAEEITTVELETFFTLKVNSATVPILTVLKSLVTVSHWIPESFVVVWENPALDRQ
jgi:hypothetical protein